MDTSIEIIQWLQQWVFLNYKKFGAINNHVLITTIDNPGWGMTANLKNCVINRPLPLANVSKSEDDWYHCTIRDNRYEGDGGLFNLFDILVVFSDLFNIKKSDDVTRNIIMNDPLFWLTQWFARQSNGDWEHVNSVRIGTLENSSGWYVDINLEMTELQDKIFHTISIQNSEHDWYECAK